MPLELTTQVPRDLCCWRPSRTRMCGIASDWQSAWLMLDKNICWSFMLMCKSAVVILIVEKLVGILSKEMLFFLIKMNFIGDV